MRNILNWYGDPIPKEIAELAIKRYNPKYSKDKHRATHLNVMFDWGISKEGSDFWSKIDVGNFEPFYKKFPKSIDEYSII